MRKSDCSVLLSESLIVLVTVMMHIVQIQTEKKNVVINAKVFLLILAAIVIDLWYVEYLISGIFHFVLNILWVLLSFFVLFSFLFLSSISFFLFAFFLFCLSFISFCLCLSSYYGKRVSCKWPFMLSLKLYRLFLLFLLFRQGIIKPTFRVCLDIPPV